MARSTFYYHLSRLETLDKDAISRDKIVAIYHKHKGRYGYRRIGLEMRVDGFVVNHKAIERIMGELGLKSLVRLKKYRSYKGQVGVIAPNVLQRNFRASKPNQKWVTDVTEFRVCGVKRYLSSILDLYNREIVSYTLSPRPDLMMVKSMFDKAVARVECCAGVVLHSDQGLHYQNPQYQKLLRDKGLVQSMSRKGNCLDNAVIENFFGILKSELLYLQRFDTIELFDSELHAYIDYYNNVRIKTKLKGMSPVQYRTLHAKTI